MRRSSGVRPPSQAQLKREAAFNTTVTARCIEMGGTPDPRPTHRPEILFETPCGKLTVTPMDTWVSARFDEPAWAEATLGKNTGRLNGYSGKWNFHASDPDALLVWFVGEVRDLLARTPVPKPIPMDELPPAPEGHIRIRLRVDETLIVPVLKRFGSVWAVHKLFTKAQDDVVTFADRGVVIVHVPTGLSLPTRGSNSVAAAARLGRLLAEKAPDLGADLKLGGGLSYEDSEIIRDLLDTFRAQEAR